MKKSDVLAWLQENWIRLRKTQPKFFKVWDKIDSILIFIGGIPTMMVWIQQIDPSLSIDILVPNAQWTKILFKVIAFIGLYGKFKNKLTVANAKEIVVDNGTIISKPTSDLPFSEKKEAPKIIE